MKVYVETRVVRCSVCGDVMFVDAPTADHRLGFDGECGRRSMAIVAKFNAVPPNDPEFPEAEVERRRHVALEAAGQQRLF